MMPPLLIYLHGFSSSPASLKAQQTEKYLEQHAYQCEYWVPALDYSPAKAIACVEQRLKQEKERQVCFIGSSLGGYYATHLAEKWRAKACLVNPAVKPFELLHQYLGENHNYHTGESFMLTEQHMDELLAIYHPRIQCAKSILVLLQTGDETLDWQQAVKAFPQSPLWITYGGDHGFQRWLAYLPAVLNFLDIHRC